MTQKPINVLVWKPYGTLEEAEKALSKIQRSKLFQEDQLFLALPIGYLSQKQWPKGTQETHYGAYEMPSILPKSFTETVAPRILKSCDAAFVVLGNAAARSKPDLEALIPVQVDMAITAGLTPLVCLGENQQQHEEGRGVDTIRRQLEQLKETVSTPEKIVFVYEAPWLHETQHLTELNEIKKAYQVCHEAVRSIVPSAKLLCAVPDELFDFDAFRTAIAADGYYFPNSHMHVGCLTSGDLLPEETKTIQDENVEITPPSFEAVAETGEAAKLLEDAVLTAAQEEEEEELTEDGNSEER